MTRREKKRRTGKKGQRNRQKDTVREERSREGTRKMKREQLTSSSLPLPYSSLSGQEVLKGCRNADIMSDAAYAILTSPSRKCTGNFFIDESLLRSKGMRREETESEETETER